MPPESTNPFEELRTKIAKGTEALVNQITEGFKSIGINLELPTMENVALEPMLEKLKQEGVRVNEEVRSTLKKVLRKPTEEDLEKFREALVKANEETGVKLDELKEKIKNAYESATEPIRKTLNNISEKLKEIIDEQKELLERIEKTFDVSLD